MANNNDQTFLEKIIVTHAGISITILRIFIGWIFFTAGMGKLFGWSTYGGWVVTMSYLEQIGVPSPDIVIFVLSLIEFVGGFFLMAGIFVRLAAIPFLIMMTVGLATVHRYVGMQFPFLLWIASVVLLEYGGGKLSIDSILTKMLERRMVPKV